ncbi:protein-L-isoaspartate O-methyltransferase [Rudaea sp.]|uniref:protein-L-isoaspartate O-methyltransferase family protein n=1 Tax=Rudaea sp. TaxID=2136325 RepID=UPI002ED4279C
MSLNVELARNNMIEQQVRPWDVLDERVLGALSAVRREDFVPAALQNLAFADMELPLGHGEVMLKPVLEGRLLQAAAPAKGESVLEIGTGSGFLTACLAHLGGNVTSVELRADFVEAARARLKAADVRNVHIEQADAVNAYDPREQFDVMIVTGAVAALPPRWREWIKPGGRLVAIAGISPVQHAILCTRDGGGEWSSEPLFETDLPYLAYAAPAPQFTL